MARASPASACSAPTRTWSASCPSSSTARANRSSATLSLSSSCLASSTRRRRSLSHSAYSATTDAPTSPPVLIASPLGWPGSSSPSPSAAPTVASTDSAIAATSPLFTRFTT
ncbi:hypothetical protein [Actinosynnema mirum]|uniref:hypothetical protein n=1 Tax=Actinosynnema mirum TaxID=40567 RepID=UPI00019ACBB3